MLMKNTPDIASSNITKHKSIIDKAGMNNIEMPVQIKQGQAVYQPMASIDAFVSLDDPETKGIHMSRLLLHVQSILEEKALTPSAVREVLQAFISSHADCSKSAYVSIRYEHPLKRKALVSENSGWRSYPVRIDGSIQEGKICLDLTLEIQYSSTCPCSAALAREILKENFSRDFEGSDSLKKSDVIDWLGKESGGSGATPHGQRSLGTVQMRLDMDAVEIANFNESGFPIAELVDDLESAVATPVQSAVKRVDEQAFARLNGENLMFSEDAARRLKTAVDGKPYIKSYSITAEHLESLHPHNAVSVITGKKK